MYKKIYLVRHGKILCGEEKRYIGITDLPLSEEGIEQAERLKEYFSETALSKAYMSPLNRCVQTADIILKGREVEKVKIDSLKELNMGEWDDKSFEYIKSLFPEQFEERGNNIADFVPPGGESFEMLRKRVMPVFEDITGRMSGNTLIIAHAGVNRVILGSLSGISLNEVFKIQQPYGCVNKIFWDETYQIWKYERVF